MKRVWSIILSLAMLLSLAACGSNSDNQSSTTDNAGNTQSEGDASTLSVEYYNTYISADPTSMDISRVSDSYSSTIINNVMEGLVRLGESDGNYTMMPGDAQTWELSEDGMDLPPGRQ